MTTYEDGTYEEFLEWKQNKNKRRQVQNQSHAETEMRERLIHTTSLPTNAPLMSEDFGMFEHPE